jgi:hypothetical protein
MEEAAKSAAAQSALTTSFEQLVTSLSLHVETLTEISHLQGMEGTFSPRPR